MYDKLIENGADDKQAEFLSKFAPGQLGTVLELLRLDAYDINRRIADELAHIRAADVDDFAQWLLESFHLNNETVMVAPAAGFYSTKGLGLNQVRIAYVLKKEDLIQSVCILKAALKKYNS